MPKTFQLKKRPSKTIKGSTSTSKQSNGDVVLNIDEIIQNMSLKKKPSKAINGSTSTSKQSNGDAVVKSKGDAVVKSNGYAVVNIDDIIVKIEKGLKSVSQVQPNWSIFRVPSRLRKLAMDKYKIYTPQLVAIGPAHSQGSFVDKSPAHLKEKDFPLKAMEEQKLVYMQSLLIRTTLPPEEILRKCGEAVKGMEEDARASYADPADRGHPRLVEMLLVDACFILELFIKHHEGDNKCPVFCNAWMVKTLQRDLSLLENQIPFLVLEGVFQVIRPQFSGESLENVSLIDLTINFFSSAWNLKEANYIDSESCKHFLDLLLDYHRPKSAKQTEQSDIVPRSSPYTTLYYIITKICKVLSFLSNNPESSGSEHRKTDWEQLPTALELSAAGIEFEKSEGNDIFDVRFEGSVLKIPQFQIDDQTETVLKNLIAYEQCCSESKHHITSYVRFMDMLINSWQDVRFLEKKQILTHLQGNSGHVSKLFNNICNEVVLKDDTIFAKVVLKIHKRYRSAWLKRLAVLKRDYFPNLWKVFAFFAAFVLLLLTALQTVYSILSYHNSN